jgi:acyl-coenzyme A thioesterase 1/2/4
VVRENQNVDGVYFLLQGQAQVLRSAGEENYQEFPLKRYDFFGHGIFGDVYSADVVAVTELTCLLLMSDHRALLEIKSVSDSDKERCLVEDILYLEPLDVRVSPNCPSFSSISVLMIKVLTIHFYHQSLESEL